MTASAHDIDVLARTVAGEARNQIMAAQIGVAYVAIRRASIARVYALKEARPHPTYGDGTIADACLAHEQFDCWDASDPNRKVIEALTLDAGAFHRAMAAALQALLGLVADPTRGATHYWDASIPTPSWADGLPVTAIGALRFVACP